MTTMIRTFAKINTTNNIESNAKRLIYKNLQTTASNISELCFENSFVYNREILIL